MADYSSDDIVSNVRLKGVQEFSTQLRNLTAQVRDITRTWKSQFSSLSSAGDWTEAYQAKLEGVGKASDIVKQRIKELQNQLSAAGERTSANGKEWDNWSNELKRAEAQQVSLNAQLKDTQVHLKTAESGVIDLRDKYKLLNESISQSARYWDVQNKSLMAAREKLSGYGAEMRNLSGQLAREQSLLSVVGGAYGSGSNEYLAQENRVKRLTADMAELRAQSISTYKAVGNLSGSMLLGVNYLSNFGDRAMKAGSSIKQLGYNTLGYSMTVGAAVAYGVAKVATLQQTLRETYNLLDQKPAGGINEFLSEYQTRIASVSKQWGVSQTQIATGMQEVVRAGYDSTTAFGMSVSAMKTATATGEDYNQILSGTTQIMSQFGLKTANATQNIKNAALVNNVIAKVANDTQTSYTGLGDAMAKVGPIAYAMGFSLKETASTLGYLSNRGIDAEQAGNNLRMVYQRLAAPTKQASNAMKELGISATNSQGKMRDLPNIMQDIYDKTKDMGNAKRMAYIKDIFGAYALTAATSLLNGQKEISKEATAAGNAAGDGYINGLAASNKKGAQAQWKIFKATLDDLSMQFARQVLPTLIQVAHQAENLMESFDNLSPSMKTFITDGVILSALFSPIAIGTGTLVQGIGLLSKGAVRGAVDLSKLVTIGKGWGIVSKPLASNAISAAASFVGFGTAADGAAASVGGFSLALTPLGAGLLAATAAVGIGVAAWELWGKKAYEADQSTEKYGANISQSAQDTFNKVQQGADNAKVDILKMGDAKPSTKNLENFKKAVDSIVTAADKASKSKLLSFNSTKSTLNSILKAGGIDADTTALVKDWIDTHQKSLSSAYKKSQTLISGYQSSINDLYKDIASHGGKATKQEQSDLEMYVDKISGIIISNISGLSKKTKSTLESLLSNDGTIKLTTGQLQTAANNYQAVIQKSVASSAKSYSAIIKDMGLKGKQASEVWQGFFKENANNLQPLIKDYQAQMQKATSEQDWVAIQVKLKKVASQLGIPFKELVKDFGISNNSLQAEILSTTHQWDNAKFKKIVLSIDGKQALQTLATAVVGTTYWKNLSLKKQELILEDKASRNILLALAPTKAWNSLSLKKKDAILNDLASGNTKKAMTNLTKWLGIKVPKKAIDAYDNTLKPTKSAQNKINNVRQYGKPMIVAGDGTGGAVNSSQKNINSVKQRAAASIKAKNDTSSAVAGARVAIATVKGKQVVVSLSVHGKNSLQTLEDQLSSIPRHVTTWVETIFSSKGKHKAVGDTNFSGGLAIMGDYGRHEPYVTPNGDIGISSNKDTLYSLPQGTKIYPSISAFSQWAGRTIDPQSIPHFAAGSSGFIPKTSLMSGIERISQSTTTNNYNTQNDNSKISSALRNLIYIQTSMINLMEQNANSQNYSSSDMAKFFQGIINSNLENLNLHTTQKLSKKIADSIGRGYN